MQHFPPDRETERRAQRRPRDAEPASEAVQHREDDEIDGTSDWLAHNCDAACPGDRRASRCRPHIRPVKLTKWRKWKDPRFDPPLARTRVSLRPLVPTRGPKAAVFGPT